MTRISCRLTGIAALALSGFLALAACSSSTNAAGSSSPAGTTAAAPSETTVTSAPPSSPVVVSTPPAASDSAGVTADQVQAALLTAADLGAKFTDSTFSKTDQPLPCAADNSPSLEQQAPSTVRVGSTIVSQALQAAMSEEIRVYADQAHAVHALALAKQGISCKTGTLRLDDGSKLTVSFGQPQDVAADIKADEALALTATSKTVNVVLVASRLGRALVLFSFSADPATPTAQLPDPIAVSAKGITKIRNS